MEKKNNGLVIILVIIVLGLSGYILYDKDVLGLKGEKKQSNTTVTDNSTKNIEDIEIGSLGNKENKIDLDIIEGQNLYFNIKDGKVIYHKQDGTEIVDSTIPDAVIQIAKGFSCAGGDARLVALTNKGEVYYNKYDTITEDNYDYKFDFIKVIADEKVYGIDSVRPNVIQTCGYNEFFAYVDKENMKIINAYKDNNDNLNNNSERKIVSASLGKSYNELYPYEQLFLPDLGVPTLYKISDGKLYFKNDGTTFMLNANMYLTVGSNYIYSDKVYVRETGNNSEYKYYIIDKNKKLYIMIVSPANSNYIYTIEETNKTIKNIIEENQSNKVTLEFNDGTSETL